MISLQDTLQAKAVLAIKKAFEEKITPSFIEIALCQDQKFGHFQCNSALKLAKILQKKPRDIAQKIVENFDKDWDDKPFVASLEIAGAGFINIVLDKTFLSGALQKIVQDPFLGISRPAKKQKIIIEFSSPNIAKELHVGHLRSTIIGDCLARVFEFLGHDVLRLNHIGDWGTQFGMLITYIKEHHPEILRGQTHLELEALTYWYKEAKKLFEKDQAFKKRGQKKVVDLQAGQEEAVYAWNLLCDISRKAFDEIYQLLDISLIERGESFYNFMLPQIVKDLENKGLVTFSDGAKCIFLDGFENRQGGPLPLMIQKSDGGYNYDTTDMAALYHRIHEEKADRIIIVTDAGQSLHFQMIFAAAKKASYFTEKQVQLDHVPFGVVLGKDKKRFRTREGDVEKLLDLLYEAIRRAKEILIERLPVLEEKKIKELARILGIDAVKYADLSCHRVKDYIFSYDKMLQLEGNTAAFLLYAYVRILGIKRKVKQDIAEILETEMIQLKHPSEIALGFHLLLFSQVLQNVQEDLLPHRLCEYLYELAEKFNIFFRDCRVEGSDQQNPRLLLCEVTAQTLEKGLDLLGLKTMERM